MILKPGHPEIPHSCTILPSGSIVKVLAEMPKLTGTITAVTTIAGGLWALCASTFATAGWTAPACLFAGFASGVDLILGIVNDATSQTKTSGNDPDKSSKRTAPQWYMILPSGELENFDDRLSELYGTNETVELVDLRRGFSHQVWMQDGYATVKTDLTGLTTSTSTGTSKNRRSNLAKRLTSKEQKQELTEATYMAQKISSGKTGGDTQANADNIGRAIANGAWQLGTYCTSILDGKEVVADIGLTLGGPGYEPDDDEPPCKCLELDGQIL